MNVIEASALGKRYGSTWALRECTLAIPGGHVAALVGPNGAGKTTLLNLAVGLTDPTAGAVPGAGTAAPAARARRADGDARPTRPPRLHGHGDNRHGRGRRVRRALLACARRARAGGRLPHPGVAGPGAGHRRGRRPARPPPGADRPGRRS